MVHIYYLEGLCRRRQWPDPRYEFYQSWNGIECVVRVNSLQYRSDKPYATADLARENAAKIAYMLCRNQSVNNGQYPSGHDHGGLVQGVPEAIGAGRRRYTANSSQSSGSTGSRSSGSSPERREPVRYVVRRTRR